ncbi:peptidylprolyl isomerase [Catellatospora sp. NPDC049609]|uniref:peptidylprolyl isomerase n=1 Tax=Catellatospora sp. NPDC049609 TaxID=3155505 RepID=UPI00341D508E
MATPPWTPENLPQSTPTAQAKGTSGALVAVVVAAIVAVLLCVVLAAVVLIVRLNSGSGPGADGAPAAAPGAGRPSPGAGRCDWLPADTAGNPHLKDAGLPASDPPSPASAGTATMRTGQGVITFELDAAKAPCAVASLTHLAGRGYFDGTRCHRLTTAGIHVLQCGDPSGTGMGGPTYRFAEENLPNVTDPNAAYPVGTVAMAKTSAPSSTGSQFFIVWGDTVIPSEYTVLGRVTSGLEVVQAIGAAGAVDPAGNASPDGAPKNPVVISALTVAP